MVCFLTFLGWPRKSFLLHLNLRGRIMLLQFCEVFGCELFPDSSFLRTFQCLKKSPRQWEVNLKPLGSEVACIINSSELGSQTSCVIEPKLKFKGRGKCM